MLYRHIAAFAAAGIVARQGDRLLSDPAAAYSVILTRNLDEALEPVDRAVGVAGGLLTGLFGHPEPDRRVAELAQQQRERRTATHKDKSFLLLRREGHIDVQLNAEGTRETESLVVCFDAFDRERLGRCLAPALAATITGLALALPRLAGLTKLVDSIVLFRDDGKQVVSLAAQAGNLTVLIEPSEAELGNIPQLLALVRASRNLGRVHDLVARSLYRHEDAFRSFLDGWTALEIFVN